MTTKTINPNLQQVRKGSEKAKLVSKAPVPRCCVCRTTKNLHKDGWYGYRCDKDSCVPY